MSPKFKNPSLSWVSLVGRWQHAGIYIGGEQGEPMILHATGERNAPPKLEPLINYLSSIDGNVSEMLWIRLKDQKKHDTFKLFNIASSLAGSNVYYPDVDYGAVNEIKRSIKEKSFLWVITKEGRTLLNNFIRSFGPKDPYAEVVENKSPTLYCSQLIYVLYKHVLGVDLEDPRSSVWFDLSNNLVLPVDLVTGDNKEVVYRFKDNNIDIYNVEAEINGRNVVIKWDVSGDVQITGFDLYVNYNNKQYIYPLQGSLRSYSVEQLPPGIYQIKIIPHGNSNPTNNGSVQFNIN